MLWQKERLLNLGISWLPKSCKYVVWSDCDLLFGNKGWAKETAQQLEKFPLVQVFETCNRLSHINLSAKNEGNICQSFASIVPSNPKILETGHFEKHGHTGYVWAARRELLDRHGLYEYAIIGSADHYMAHASFGDFQGACMGLLTNQDTLQLEHFTDWAEPFFKSVDGKVGSISGTIFHLWHGDLERRRYLLRNRQLTECGFNPYNDLLAKPGKPLEWRQDLDKQKLITMFDQYFVSRQEDGLAETISQLRKEN